MNLDDITLQKYLRGECSAEEAEEINRWLGEDKAHRETLFNLELCMQLPQKKVFEQEEFLRSAEERLLARIEQYENSLAVKSRAAKLRRRILAWSCSAAAAILIFACLYTITRESSPAMVSVTASVTDPVKEVILPDGTRVWLNRGGTLTYSEKFGKTDRAIHLEGEAYFRIAHNEQLPFVVSSPALRVTALGTVFNMHSYHSSQLAHVSLVEGAVEVRGNNNEGQIVLSPSQRAELDLTSGRMTVKTVNTKLDAVWHNNLIPFNEASIYDIAETLEELYKVKIVFPDNFNIPGYYSGAIQQKDGIGEVLRSLTNTIPFTYTIQGTTVYLSNR